MAVRCRAMTTVPGMLDRRGAARRRSTTGAIDTVLVAFPDLQGRLVGKRVTGHYWRDHMQRRAPSRCTRATTCSRSTSR